MKHHLSTAGIVLATSAMLAACGGGNSSSSAPEQKTASEEQAAALDLATHSLATDASSLNSSDAHVLTADNATKSAEATAAIVKSVPVVPRSLATEVPTIDLGALPAAELAKRDANNKRSATNASAKAYQIGVGRDVAATSLAKNFQQTLVWNPLPNGGTTGTAQFSSTGAVGMRLGLKVEALPGSALVRVSSANADTALQISGASINQAIAANVGADGDSEAARTYWLPTTTGSTTELVIELPAGVDASSVVVSVPSLSHMLETLSKASVEDASQKSACPALNPDPVCNATLPPAANAVAKIGVTDLGGSYVCTGTLLADKTASNTPYFLTANHCIGSQTVASSLESLWFYRSSFCNSGIENPLRVYQSGGANLLFNRSELTSNTRNPIGTDTSFLRLNTTPPAGAMFAGWTINRQAISNAVPLTAFHHPSGGVLRQSTGTVSGMALVSGYTNFLPRLPIVQQSSDTTQAMYRTSWSAGITEGGSSGSGLFLNGTTTNPQIVGQLWGGSSTCTAPTLPDVYGRFDLAYQDGLIDWLNPGYKMVFRFFNINNGSHFFSANVTERDTVRNTVPSLVHEGPAFSVAPAAGSGLSPVHRFLNRSTGVHFYTINEDELAAVMNMPTFNYEGIAWYARKATNPVAGTIEVFRFSRLATGTHLYTTNVAEKDSIIANLGGSYRFEGVAYLAWPVN